jgi:hypothetical protein
LDHLVQELGRLCGVPPERIHTNKPLKRKMRTVEKV